MGKLIMMNLYILTIYNKNTTKSTSFSLFSIGNSDLPHFKCIWNINLSMKIVFCFVSHIFFTFVNSYALFNDLFQIYSINCYIINTFYSTKVNRRIVSIGKSAQFSFLLNSTNLLKELLSNVHIHGANFIEFVHFSSYFAFITLTHQIYKQF